MFLILVVIAGPDVVGTCSGEQNYIMFGIIQGVTFAAGFNIIMTMGANDFNRNYPSNSDFGIIGIIIGYVANLFS